MKVQFLKQYTDEYGVKFECGWTAEVTDPHGQRLIDSGYCIQAPKNTRPTRSTQILETCLPAVDAAPEAPKLNKKRRDPDDEDA